MTSREDDVYNGGCEGHRSSARLSLFYLFSISLLRRRLLSTGTSMVTRDTLGDVHFIGIGGAGMRGLARVFAQRGARVTGCDASPAPQLRTTFGEDAVDFEHDPAHLSDRVGEPIDLVVHTAALPDDHAELEAARAREISTHTYSEALGLVFNDATGVAVAGTHGKTTCATMLAIVLEEAGHDPTAVIGGNVRRWGGHARAGEGAIFVAEACEFGGNFHAMEPTHVLLTNIDRAHLDFYPDHEAIKSSFRDFLETRTGTVVANDDDPGAREVVAHTSGASRRVGRGDDVAWHIRPGEQSEERYFRLERGDGASCSPPLTVPIPGDHQLDNAAEVAAMARELGLDWSAIAAGLEAYDGVGRRFEVVRSESPRVVDDYAHHPEEIATTVAAAREARGDRAMTVCFQPHQYKRTFHFMGEWAPAFEGVERLWLVDIYGARDHDGEPRATLEDVADEVRNVVGSLRLFESPESLGRAIRKERAEGEFVLILGAGDIRRAAEMVGKSDA